MKRFSTIRPDSLARMMSIVVFFALAGPSASVADTDLPPGTARGSLTFEGHTAELKFAAAFVDQKDSDKPVVLLLTDTKLPTEKWTSEFDMMRDKTKWNGIVFFLKDGIAIRSDIEMTGRHTSISGIFELKLDNSASKELTGTATTDEGAKNATLKVTFHATLK
jgi:hypothetical protein